MERSGKMRRELEDVPEVIHRIQLLLPAREAARTCVLSKSWLHAWSTIPSLRFTKRCEEEEEERRYMSLIDSTLQRYLRSNIPIESVDLHFAIKGQESACLAQNWIRSLVSGTTCLKELSLTVFTDFSFTLADEIFSGDNLTTISLSVHASWSNSLSLSLSMNYFPVLLVLELLNVNIKEELLNHLLSICSLLEKINLDFSGRGFKTLKVKNLVYLRQLKIKCVGRNDILEIDHVPSLRLIHYHSLFDHRTQPLPFNMDPCLPSVTELSLIGGDFHPPLLHMIQSKFPSLETLSLKMGCWTPETLVITRWLSLKSLTLNLFAQNRPLDVQVVAPKLVFFCYIGKRFPCLSFPSIAPPQVKLIIKLWHPIDLSFFLNLRDLLYLSSKFHIHIQDLTYGIKVPSNIDFDGLTTLFSSPSTNVQQLSFQTERLLRDYMPFFVAFISAFHPIYVNACRHKPLKLDPEFCKQMVSLILDTQTPHPKDVEIKNPRDGKWETLTNSWTSPLFADWYSVDFKLNWPSQ